MSWTQIHVSGLNRSIEPADEVIEQLLDERYQLSSDDSILWAGVGTTLIKRDDQGTSRGFAFMSFYSKDGALCAIDKINNYKHDTSSTTTPQLPTSLHAEISNPKGKKKKNNKDKEEDLPDLRLRRQRAPPIRKHPVITSSDGKRTNLGNKTK